MGIYYQDNTVEIKIFTPQEIADIKHQTAVEQDRIRQEKFKNNINVRRQQRRTQINKQLKNDSLFKLRHNIRNLIRNSINYNGFSKKTKTYAILGCSCEEFKAYIEGKFKDGMTWENYGAWEYDHIVPVSWASTEDDVIKLNHYTNFQPLWRAENNAKRNKFSG